MQNRCAEIKIRAERRAGELLRGMEETRGGDHKSEEFKNQTSPDERIDSSPRLKDLGINYAQSSRWQSVASLPEDQFESYIAQAKDSTGSTMKPVQFQSSMTLASRSRLHSRNHRLEAAPRSYQQARAVSAARENSINSRQKSIHNPPIMNTLATSIHMTANTLRAPQHFEGESFRQTAHVKHYSLPYTVCRIL